VASLQVPVSIRIRPHQLQHREDGVDSAEVIRENELKFVCAVFAGLELGSQGWIECCLARRFPGGSLRRL
jgi:hypothetical protein